MTDKIIIAGFGGQGIITLGLIMSYIGMKAGKNITHFPSYGAEMRGGTANCSVIISDEEIFSPVFVRPTGVIAMNKPSFLRFGPVVEKDGYLLVDSTHISETSVRKDLEVVSAPVTDEADRCGDVRTANIVMLGVWIRIKGMMQKEHVKRCLAEFFRKKKVALVDLNIAAFERGWSLV